MDKKMKKETKESAAVQKEPAAEKLDTASLPELTIDRDNGCIIAKFDDGREPVTVELNGAQFAAAVLKISNEISCCESKAQEKILQGELEEKARACREELKNSKVSNTGLNDEINFIINSLKKRKQEGDYPLRYRLICLSSTLNKFLEDKKVADPSTKLGERLKELHDFLKKNKNRIESHYGMEELGEELSRLYKLPVDQKRTWLNKFKGSKYFKENENRDYGRVVSNLLSEARETIKAELEKNGINLSVETFLPMGSKRMKYPRKKIQFQGSDPFFEVAKGVLAIKGLQGIILSEDGTEIKFIPKDIEGELKIPEGVKKVCWKVFEDCDRITDIRIPESLVSVDENKMYGTCAFSQCSSLEYIEVDEKNPVYKSVDGMLLNKEGTAIIFVPREINGLLSIPEGLVEIEKDTFKECRGVTSVVLAKSVTKIGESAFEECSGLTSITIPEGVIKIGEKAFSGCTGLTNLTIPEGISKIGSSAFENCTGLTNITIPEGVTWIEEFTFAGCTGLKDVSIPESVTEIRWNAFSGCTGLTSITIPEGVTKIWLWAFAGCTGLKRITIPESVREIEQEAFLACSELEHIELAEGNLSYKIMDEMILDSQETEIIFALKKIKGSLQIPESVRVIGDDAFSSCTGLTSITIPKGVTKIGANAFRGCTGLTSITIPKSVTKIWDYAFEGCTGLTSITIMGSATKIGLNAFMECTGLASITIPESVAEVISIPESVEEVWKNVFKDCRELTSVTLLRGVTKIYESAFKEWIELTSITIPEGVTEIGENAFLCCTGLTNIAIPEGVTRIGDFAFQGCTGLTSITIPESVTEIGLCAFAGCTGLTSITIPEGVTKIGEGALKRLAGYLWKNKREAIKIGQSAFFRTGLLSIKIPESVTEIESGTFAFCTGLKNITIPKNVSKIGASAFEKCGGLISVTMSKGVVKIGDFAFKDCTELTSITIPESVTEIGVSAFAGCTGLKSITIPKSVTEIRESAFGGCTGLTSITISESVIKIGKGAFAFCKGLTSITIPKSVNEIGESVFAGCDQLECIEVSKANPVYKVVDGILLNIVKKELICTSKKIKGELHIPKGVTKIGVGAFAFCSGLTSVIIRKGVTEIGMGAFAFCSKLASIIIPNGVTKIGNGAFVSCIGLTSITIPKSVNEIGESVFAGCDQLECIEVSKANPVYKVVDGVLLNMMKKELLCASIKGELRIPDGVSKIGMGAFAHYTGLMSITIPESVTEIGDGAFEGCISLKEIYFECDAPDIGSDVFGNVQATVYYRKGANGWGEIFGGLPTKEIEAENVKNKKC